MSTPPSRRDTRLLEFHPESRFGGFSDIDGTIMFWARVQEVLPADGVALDVGCGRGTQAEDPVRIRGELRTLRGNCAKAIGIDLDPAGEENEAIDEFRLMEDPSHWPVDDASIDLAVADYVVEHVTDPAAFFKEAARVLKPGGLLGLRTPSTRSYLGVASRLVPTRAHARVLSRLQPERPSEDVFPTVYRCNTRRRLRRAFADHGFDAVVYGSESEPGYLSFSRLTYALGLFHQRFAPQAIKVGLIGWGRRR
jgi:SAM-dependent methyltransferase